MMYLKKALILSLLLLTSCFLYAQPTEEFTPDSFTRLLLHFNEGSGDTAYDVSGNDLHGVFGGNAAWTAGRFDDGLHIPPLGDNCAISLDGESAYCEVPDHSSQNFGTGDFTIEVMVRLDSTSSWYDPYIIGKRFGIGLSYYALMIRQGTTLPMFAGRGEPGTQWIAESSIPLNLDQWYHLAGVRSGDILIFYVDGVEVARDTTAPGDVNTAGGLFGIGRFYYGDTGRFFTGDLDEGRIWNVARSQSEIQSAMSVELTGSETGLVGLWQFNECSGSFVENGTQNGNDGTLHNTFEHIATDWENPTGTGAHVNCGSSALLRPDIVTCEAWIKADSVRGNDMHIVTSAKDFAGFGLYLTDGGKPSFRVENGSIYEAISPDPISPDTWYHLAGTFNGDSAVIWVGGVPMASITGSLAPATWPLVVGSDVTPPYTSDPFRGDIDEVRVSDIVRYIYSETSTETCPSLNFDGDGDYVDVTYDEMFNFGDSQDFSIAARIRASSSLDCSGNDACAGIVAKATHPAPFAGYQLTIRNGNIASELYSNAYEFQGTSDITDDAWHNVALCVSRSMNYAKLFVDGVEEASIDITGMGSLATDSMLVIGAGRGRMISLLGDISEVQISNSDRSGTGGALMDLPDENIIGMWTFEDEFGSTLTDFSGNNFDGTIYGADWNTCCQLSGSLAGTIGPGVCQVVGDISVDEGNSLTILPGTILDFQGAYKFLVYGYLEAVGTEVDSIIFTCDTLENPDRWRGIQFDNADAACRLEYCVIENSGAYEVMPHDRGGGIWANYSSPTFSHCLIHHCKAADDAGGAYFRYNCNPTFEYCTFSDNHSVDAGAASFCRDNCVLTFSNCTFSRNRAGQEGGALAIGIGCTLDATECTFLDNLADVHGGALYSCDGATIILTTCTMNSNTTAQTGGAVHFADAQCNLIDCDITNNTAETAGGLYFIDADSSRLTDCTISGNSATGGVGIGAGGGVYFYSTDVPTIENCLITGNYTTGNGGGGIVCHTSPAAITSCTISGNSTSGSGGGIWCEGTTAALMNTIVWGNCADVAGNEVFAYNSGSYVELECCDVDSTGISNHPQITWVANNIFQDPLFCDPEDCENAPTTEGGYTLNLCSPCTDFFRPACGRIGTLDIGCTAAPAPVTDLVIDSVGVDVRLRWSPVTTAHCGAPLNIDYYLVYYSEFSDGPYFYHGYTADTCYIHSGALQFATTMYYKVEAYVGPIGLLNSLPTEGILTREQIIILLKR